MKMMEHISLATGLISFFLTIIGICFAFESPRKAFLNVARRLVFPYRRAKTTPDWIARLNAFFAHEVRIFCQTSRDPLLRFEGHYFLTDQQAIEAERQREELSKKRLPNDMHAIVVGETNWHATPVVMRLQLIDFAGITALRREGLRPKVLSAGALLISSEMNKVILHRRSSEAATYPNALHILGGGYMPPSDHSRENDGESLRETAERELREEIKLSIPIPDTSIRVLAEELSTGFIQLVYIGCNISADMLSRARPNWEGHVEEVLFQDLPKVLHDPSWVPSGKAHVLAWIALGAPGWRRGVFGMRAAQQLFDDHVNTASDQPDQRGNI